MRESFKKYHAVLRYGTDTLFITCLGKVSVRSADKAEENIGMERFRNISDFVSLG
jgi:hypothetical protein